MTEKRGHARSVPIVINHLVVFPLNAASSKIILWDSTILRCSSNFVMLFLSWQSFPAASA